jgi:hypothetical protein
MNGSDDAAERNASATSIRSGNATRKLAIVPMFRRVSLPPATWKPEGTFGAFAVGLQ